MMPKRFEFSKNNISSWMKPQLLLMKFLMILPLISCLLVCMIQTCVNTCNSISLPWKWSCNGRVKVYRGRHLLSSLDRLMELRKQAGSPSQKPFCPSDPLSPVPFQEYFHMASPGISPGSRVVSRLCLEAPVRDVWQSCWRGNGVIMLFLWSPFLGKLIIIFFILSC